MTTPITNDYFRTRVFKLVEEHLALAAKSGDDGTSMTTSAWTDPILPPLTPEDTSVYPSPAVNTYTGCLSPWIDLSSPNRIISSISRQVLNMEINYANFAGLRSLIITGPAKDASPKTGGSAGLAQYSRAVQEALTVGSRLNFLVHMPMYREPGLDGVETLSSLRPETAPADASKEIDLYTAWDSWNNIRSVCNYDMRLFVGIMKAPLSFK